MSGSYLSVCRLYAEHWSLRHWEWCRKRQKPPSSHGTYLLLMDWNHRACPMTVSYSAPTVGRILGQSAVTGNSLRGLLSLGKVKCSAYSRLYHFFQITLGQKTAITFEGKAGYSSLPLVAQGKKDLGQLKRKALNLVHLPTTASAVSYRCFCVHQYLVPF